MGVVVVCVGGGRRLAHLRTWETKDTPARLRWKRRVFFVVSLFGTVLDCEEVSALQATVVLVLLILVHVCEREGAHLAIDVQVILRSSGPGLPEETKP